ncbi:pyridoxal 5'-phosphate synthase glutaminase subunit PdxT [Bifidobacterium cuniculi]|uniref:Pyridoxal 5'-phosphate synthase subunit PdxT n=1 Tax=Bifidobacterium cuniculi TaxID=1688 RepID=A0A087B5A7_9BIFI|nr:pyridoxal 5'-phosphate synthase glutaminase subunit PdxT [Bifidobacterium cuniculi]KFI66207.1 glutamine amidotransferase subunit PdxT [Bifidobacterium cuniculi]
MVVDVSYISKEHSEGIEGERSGVTGILAVQGAFAEHAAMLDRLGAPWKLLRAADDFDASIDRVILPGGESTTQGKLLRSTGLFDPIAAHIAAGKPTFGTCAGMILLASALEQDDTVYFGALDATVRRNAYGRQLGSFMTTEDLDTYTPVDGLHSEDDPSGVIADMPMVFIRGPLVASVGDDARIMAVVDGDVVALQQGRILATAFHPEVTDDTRVHEYFLGL